LTQRLCRLPQRLGRSSKRVCRLPQRLGRLPQRLGRSSQRLCRLPQRLCRLPQRLGRSFQRLCRLPQRLGRSFQRLCRLPQRQGRSSNRLCRLLSDLVALPKDSANRSDQRFRSSIRSKAGFCQRSSLLQAFEQCRRRVLPSRAGSVPRGTSSNNQTMRTHMNSSWLRILATLSGLVALMVLSCYSTQIFYKIE
jgi:hypothetical protein